MKPKVYEDYIRKNFTDPDLFELLGDFPWQYGQFTSIYRDIKTGNTVRIILSENGKLLAADGEDEDYSKEYMSYKGFLPAKGKTK